jgi:UDP-glucose 4-epimerase
MVWFRRMNTSNGLHAEFAFNDEHSNRQPFYLQQKTKWMSGFGLEKCESMRCLVTGGAGFIGCELVRRLLQWDCEEVLVYDNFSSGSRERLNALNRRRLRIVEEDLKYPKRLSEALSQTDVVFHLAANPDVKNSSVTTESQFQENLYATFRLLEEMRKCTGSKILVFTSTSTVYGEKEKPSSEEDVCKPISVYGATKLACEALIEAYVGSGLLESALIMRLANIVGPASNHGVIFDFIRKLKEHPTELEILGDGKQNKSYLHVEDTVEGIMVATQHVLKNKLRFAVFNVGSTDTIIVDEIAQIVCQKMGLKPHVKYVNKLNGRGWPGDVKSFLLDTTKLRSVGWSPKHNSRSSVERTVEEFLSSNAAP